MKEKETTSKTHKVLTVIGIIMCVILIPILIVNCTLLVKSFINKEDVPDFAGTMPLIVLTDSMYPDIKSGDLIICKTVDAKDVNEGDVISFFDPAGNGTSVVTHKVVEVIEENGERSFRTRGINNNTDDKLAVPADNVIAVYTGIRIPGAGNVAIFMQSTTGLIVCVVLPIILLVGYDIIRRRRYEKNKGDDVAVLMAELEALRAAQNAPKPEAKPEAVEVTEAANESVPKPEQEELEPEAEAEAEESAEAEAEEAVEQEEQKEQEEKTDVQ